MRLLLNQSFFIRLFRWCLFRLFQKTFLLQLLHTRFCPVILFAYVINFLCVFISKTFDYFRHFITPYASGTPFFTRKNPLCATTLPPANTEPRCATMPSLNL